MAWLVAVVAAVVAAASGFVIGRESAPPDVQRDERPRTKTSVWVARLFVVVAAVGNFFGAFVGFVIGAGIGVARRMRSERAPVADG